MIDVTTRPPAVAPRSAPRPDLGTRVLIAARDCIAANGLRATTVDDIAASAGCGRASIYRVFPGGRRGVLQAMVAAEVRDLLTVLAADVDDAPDLSSAVSDAVHTGAVLLVAHPALQRLLEHEPDAVMPFISFDGAAPLLATVAAWGRVHLALFLPAESAEAVGEWAARLVLAHLHSRVDLLALTDAPAVRHLVDTYLMPGLRLPVPT